MTKAPSVNRPRVITLWPWVIGAFLLGFAASILMPTLLLALILGLSVWGLARWGHQTPASRKAVAIDLGLGIAAAFFLTIWIAGNITR